MREYSHIAFDGETVLLARTEAEAAAFCEKALSEHREEAVAHGWEESDVTQICYGPLAARVERSHWCPKCEDESCDHVCGLYHGDAEESVDYALTTQSDPEKVALRKEIKRLQAELEETRKKVDVWCTKCLDYGCTYTPCRICGGPNDTPEHECLHDEVYCDCSTGVALKEANEQKEE